MVAHVLSLNTGTAAVLNALTTPNGVSGVLALDTSDSNRPRLFEGTLGGRKLAWLDEVPPISTAMLITASNATNPTALSNLTGAILSYSGSTLSLQSGKTLDLSAGTTVLSDSGRILPTTGELSLGTSTASARLTLGGTYTTANQGILAINGTLSSSVTGTIAVINTPITVIPTGASSNTIQGYACDIHIGTTSLNIANFQGYASRLNFDAGYSGTLTTAVGFAALNPIISGGTVSSFHQFQAGVLTANNNISSGSAVNRQFYAQGITAGAAGGIITNRGIEISVPSGGASSGTANNRGLHITGNGGTSSGGTVNNFAVYSDSTANSRLLGFFGLGGDPLAQLHLQGNISAAAWTTSGIRVRHGSSTFTDTSSSGTVATAYTNSFAGGTIAASSATTFTNYFNSYFSDPTAGTNVTLTNKYALGADSAKIVTLTLASTTLLITTVALTNGAAGNTATMTNAPAAGDPTKWIPINDNGTTRYIPAW